MTKKKIRPGKNTEIEKIITTRKDAEKEERRENSYSLYDNPMVTNARKNMSEEQLETYKSYGESMYNSIDFVDSSGKSRNIPEDMVEGVSYVINSINSGMHISYLEENERLLLADVLGNEWYKKFGYDREDLFAIVNTPSSNVFIEEFQNGL